MLYDEFKEAKVEFVKGLAKNVKKIPLIQLYEFLVSVQQITI